MKAEVVKMTPKLAANLLKKNKRNRKISEKKVDEYANAMSIGQWRENGESIIIDKQDQFKDGQHRLLAVIKANYTCNMVLVTGVEPDVMDSIDVGKNRSLADMLQFQGEKDYFVMASIINKLLPYHRKQYGHNVKITNAQGLDFYIKNEKNLKDLSVRVNRLYQSQNFKILSPSEIAVILYAVSGYKHHEKTTEFLNYIMGNAQKPGNAATWVQRQFYKYKKDKTRLNLRWKLAVTLKAWNYFIDGDPPIKNIKWDIEHDKMPTPKKITQGAAA